MQTKHFIDDPTHLVHTALHSLTLTNPSVAFDLTNKIIYRRPTKELLDEPKVSIISGGGSGHEPAFAGFVGKGFLTAGVAGTIFASPNTLQVQRAIMSRVPTEKGVLVITFNYTGDVLNFGLAAEKAKAAGVETEFFAIGDDVGVGREKGGKVGRRGIGGSILVLKIICALAELGGSLSEVYTLAKKVAGNLVSVGASMEHVHVPGRENPNSDEIIPTEEIEVGMGIHNEPGSHKVSATLPELVKIMLAQMIDPEDKDRHFVHITKQDKVVLLINNLGGVSNLEIGGVVAEVHTQLKEKWGITPVRVIVGTFITSLNGLGFSASLLKLDDTGLGQGKSMLELLDAPAEAFGWAAATRTSTWEADNSATMDREADSARDLKASHLSIDAQQAHTVLKAGLDKVIVAEPEVTKYDTIVGDGDCGIGLKRGAEAVLKELSSGDLPTDAVAFLNKIVPVVEHHTDGTSGALYSIFLNALVHGLREQDTGSSQKVDAKIWAAALKSARTALGKYTPAAVGDRTLIDALDPFIETLSSTGDVKKAAEAAKEGTEKTKTMKASLGRAVYVGAESEWMGKVPDPGAVGLQELLLGIAGAS
ncbi:dihydroxyacetone kinase Dak1 [Elasticomyces elasticus]|uniref:Dihydroxyacetone kinase Dak1 n=1 Tax=Exophiala sideris TaxID=1016849 RepID=A0ABR0JHW2_9EURO|nr:dihydroxyacetone kinase Dak1 [Elasticomyces elasticus]KAK5034185.1 dihydroxyacetone kinase Dak1 [Exophiala sideris]KAK5042481.1 dihydroxyacetone kinase Dak1 [Exophiala sideris]KAK5065563.1 dihydroxyacetone kinase Dak1 [Exophiala sideris]KAK5185979.1 dihydroxyacetone kinase Dak1 [Eurotiomycetes sp. CCFEE 6388]